MKIAITADLHLARYGHDVIDPKSNLPERLSSIKNVLNYIATYSLENEINQIAILGDLLHGKSIIYSIAQNILLSFFRSYPDLEFIVIDGNHDLSGKGEDVCSALVSLDNEPNVIRVTSDYMFIESENILLVPYSTNMVDVIKNKSAKYLFSHFGLNEGVLNSGISVISDLSLNDLRSKYQYVILGHYHKPQEIIRDDISCYYCGSPIQLDWGEKHDEKRFLVINTDNDTIESVPFDGYKKFYSFELRKDNYDEVIKKAKELSDQGHHVTISKLEKIDTKDIQEQFRIVDRTEVDITNRGITSTMSREDKLRSYMDIKQIPENERDSYLKVGLSIIESCQNIEG